MPATSKYFNAVNSMRFERPLKRLRTSSMPSTTDGNTVIENVSSRLGPDFFQQECRVLARSLLGKILVRQFNDGSKVWGKIVETEAYLGSEDKASHSYANKKTKKNTPMFMEPGTVYVYSIYGIYYCVNVSSQGEGAAVLIRAVEPLGGLELMENLRKKNNKTPKKLTVHHLCNGPSKICLSFGIDRHLNAVHLCSSESIWIEDCTNEEQTDIVTTSRIGMSKKSEEWAMAPLRYYLLNSSSVSVFDRNQENQMRLKVCK